MSWNYLQEQMVLDNALPTPAIHAKAASHNGSMRRALEHALKSLECGVDPVQPKYEAESVHLEVKKSSASQGRLPSQQVGRDCRADIALYPLFSV
jgi:hypothetical protein